MHTKRGVFIAGLLALLAALPAWGQTSGQQSADLIAENLVTFTGRKTLAARTEVRLSKDAESFTVHVRAEEPAMAKAVAKATAHDQPVWLDDAVTVFIDPARNTERVYFVCVNLEGAVADGWLDAADYLDLAWESNSNVRVTKGKDHWTVTVRVPYSAFGATPAPGDAIGYSVTRRRVGDKAELGVIRGTYLSSRACRIPFPEPAGFLSFSVGRSTGEVTVMSASRGGLDPARPNANWFRAVADNKGTVAIPVVVDIRTERGKTLGGKRFVVLPKARTPLNTGYGGDFATDDRIVFSVRREGAKSAIYRSAWRVAAPIGKRVYERKGPCDTSLLTKKRLLPGPYAAMTWPQGAGVPRMTSFALRNGHPWSRGGFWKALAGEVTVPIQTNDRPTPGGQYSDMRKNADFLRANGLKALFIPNAWEIGGRRDYWSKLGVYGGFKPDPQMREDYFASLRRVLSEHGDLVWGIFISDEMHYSTIKNGVKLYASKRNEYPFILEIDADVKKRFGYGKYGIPHSLNDKNPWRWVAWKRWVVDFADGFERKALAQARKLKPDIVAASIDPQGEVQPYDITRWRDGRYDLVLWQTCASTNPVGTRGALVPKFVTDLVRPKEFWPCVHAESLFASFTPVELRQILSGALVNGATGLHFFPLEQRGRGNLGNLERYGAPERWAYWVKAAKFFAQGWRARMPEGQPGAALFFSNDAHMAIPAPWCWSGLVGPPFAYLSCELRSDFEFIDEGGIERGYFKPDRYKVIIVPYAKVERPSIVSKLAEAAMRGATLVVTDMEAFRFDRDGSERPASRRELLGDIKLVKTPSQRKRALSQSAAFLAGRRLEFDVVEPTFWELVGCTYTVEPGGGDTVLMRYADGSPAAVVHPVGKGRVIWIGFNVYGSNYDKPPALKEYPAAAREFFRALLANCEVKMDLEHYSAMLPEGFATGRWVLRTRPWGCGIRTTVSLMEVARRCVADGYQSVEEP